ncbi:hypothetical protein M9H77_11894 [Catharanthus roseus]|uniref:Uncharacterized protein n=1 Tax=Catharanthus roseus TaxID=4058 RepID=A0ACC0BFX1_CATRO|nr:hypothetical protein M9H77_11894 [Catharanthus roseus]
MEEILCLSVEQGYMVFYRNCEDSNVQYATVGSRRNPGQVWTSEVLYFGVETTNRAESEHSVLKLWLSTCHGDLDTMFLNVDSVIESQIAEIKSSLEISKLKEKLNTKSNAILKNISNHISHWNWRNVVGDGNFGFRVVANFLFGDENHRPEVSGPPPYYLCIRIRLVLSDYCVSATSQSNRISYSYICEMDVHYLLCTCNGNIIVIIK